MSSIKAMMTGTALTVVLSDGTVLLNTEGSMELLNKVKACSNDDEVVYLMTPELTDSQKKVKEEIKENRQVLSMMDALCDTGDFEKDGDTVKMIGINRTLPKSLIQKFHSIVNTADKEFDRDAYTGLKNFWYWCCLNPRAEVADKLYDFLDRNSFRINKQGMFFALRNVVTLEAEKSELSKYVSEQYVKIKSWKKNPANYWVVANDAGGYRLEKDGKSNGIEKWEGNLKELYLNIPDMDGNRYTDAHTRTFAISIGKKVSMDPKDCSWSTADCGERGLHFTSNEIHYVGCGDTSMIIMINPSKVVGIGTSKGRCYEYLPIAAINREEATTILHDQAFDTMQLDWNYAIDELDNLEEVARERFSVEAKKYDFNLPGLSAGEMAKIVSKLNEIKNDVSGRIVEIE